MALLGQLTRRTSSSVSKVWCEAAVQVVKLYSNATAVKMLDRLQQGMEGEFGYKLQVSSPMYSKPRLHHSSSRLSKLSIR